MTSRMDELHGFQDDAADDDGDVEAGLDAESERLMARFNKEADAIRNVLDWSRASVDDVARSFAAARPSTTPARLADAAAKLDLVEDKLAAVRRRLKRIAGENRDFRRDHARRTAATRARVVQYKHMGDRFLAVTKDLEAVRGRHRDALARSVRADVMAANPALTERDADAAMAAGGTRLESAMVPDRADTADLRYQVEDVKNRNAEIAKLGKNMADLNAMFVDMGILVDGQQELLNNIEYNVEEVKDTTQKATEELVLARKHQKSKKKKKCVCMIVCILICIAAALAVLIPVGNKLGWFNGITGGGNDNNSNAGRRIVVTLPPDVTDVAAAAATPAAAASATPAAAAAAAAADAADATAVAADGAQDAGQDTAAALDTVARAQDMMRKVSGVHLTRMAALQREMQEMSAQSARN